MIEKPEIVKQYEQRKESGESMYFDPVELDEIFHYYAESEQDERLPEIIQLANTLHPGDLVAVTIDAEYSLNMGEPEECLKKLEPVFSEDNLLHCILKSGALARLGELMGAIDYAEKAVADGEPLVAYDIGLGFMNAEQPTIALRYFSQCLDAYPNDIKTIVSMMLCLSQVGTPEEVMHYVERALEIDSFCIEAWITKGRMLYDKEQWKEAEECFDYALAISPDDTDSLVMKAHCCLKQGRVDDALHAVLEVAERMGYGTNVAELYLLAAHIHHEAKDLASARDMAWKAIQADPTNPDITERAAIAFTEFDAPDDAIAMLETIVRQKGNKASTYLLVTLGEQYTKRQYYQEAIDTYQMAIDKEPSAAVYAMQAGVYMTMRHYRKAYRTLQKATEMEVMWQAYLLLTICAYYMGWETAMFDNYVVAHCLDAEHSKDLLELLDSDVHAHFTKMHLYELAEEQHQELLKTTVHTARKRLAQRKREMQQLNEDIQKLNEEYGNSRRNL